MLKRYFKSYTKDNDQEYSVEVDRNDDSFVANVSGQFGSMPKIERTFTASGPDAEQKVQEWLITLDEEVRKLIAESNNVQLPASPAANSPVPEGNSGTVGTEVPASLA